MLSEYRQRQRRIVAPNLNERISETVWDESCLQAKAMLQHMVQNPGDQTLNGLRAIAKNVIGKAGYDANMPWTMTEHHTPGSLGGETGAYFQTISLVADNILSAALLPSWFMRLPIMPCSLQTLGAQMDKVPQYIKSMLKGERESASKKPRDNFLSMLVRLSDQEAKSSGSFLTEEEISGNLFTFTAAGFDSTANTMGYAVTLLAAYPEWQEWIREELSGLDADLTRWTYESIYSKCPRILSVMVRSSDAAIPLACTNSAHSTKRSVTSHRYSIQHVASLRRRRLLMKTAPTFFPRRWKCLSLTSASTETPPYGAMIAGNSDHLGGSTVLVRSLFRSRAHFYHGLPVRGSAPG